MGIDSQKVNLVAVGSMAAYFAKRTLGYPYVSLSNASVKSKTICNSKEIEAIAPYYWDQHLPRILSSRTYSAKKLIKEDLNRKVFRLEPVDVHWLKDAILYWGSVYSAGNRYLVAPATSGFLYPKTKNAIIADVDEAALVSTCAGSTWWGHWIMDEVPLQMMAEKFAVPAAFDREAHYDEIVFRKILGVKEPDIYRTARFKSLILLQGHAQSILKTKCYHAIRKRLAPTRTGHKMVYLRRGNTGSKRTLVNELEVISALESIGFVIVDLENVTPTELVRSCSGTEVLVSVEGSHLAPIIFFLKEFASLVILNPPHRVLTTIADVATFCRISSGMFICEATNDSKTDFLADPKELLSFIDSTCSYSSSNLNRLDSFVDNILAMKSKLSI